MTRGAKVTLAAWIGFLALSFFQPCCEAMAVQLPCHQANHVGVAEHRHATLHGQALEHALCVKLEAAAASSSQIDGKLLQWAITTSDVTASGFPTVVLAFPLPFSKASHSRHPTSSSDQDLYLTTQRLRI